MEKIKYVSTNGRRGKWPCMAGENRADIIFLGNHNWTLFSHLIFTRHFKVDIITIIASILYMEGGRFCNIVDSTSFWWCLLWWFGEGNGTLLQYSCLENPMDGGAWYASVHGVAKGWTCLGDFTFTFHFHALERAMATHSSVLAWRIPGTGEPGVLTSMGSHRVRHDWIELAAAALWWLQLLLGVDSKLQCFFTIL